MPERSIPTRYYGVPEAEHSALERKRERSVQKERELVERVGIALPTEYHELAKELIAEVGAVARHYRPDIVLPTPDDIIVVPDDRFDGSGIGGYLAESRGMIIRLSELFQGDYESAHTVWQTLQEEVRAGYAQACAVEFELLPQFPYETQVSCVLMAVLTVDELRDMVFDIPKSLPPVRAEILKKVDERISSPHVAKFIRESIEALFVSNVEFDAYKFIREASIDEPRAAYQVMYIGRLAKRLSGTRAVRHLLENADARRLDSVRETITHELVHATAHNLFVEFPDGSSDRSGYRVPRRDRKSDFVLKSLNEACTESIAQGVLANSNGLDAMLVAGENSAYAIDRVLLVHIIVGIAKTKKETLETVWSRFERGYFTGELMHLRDIEKTFGREAWDYYKQLMPDELRKPSRATKQKIKKYFKLDL